MAKKFLVTALALALVVGALVGIKVLQFKAMFAQTALAAAPPEAVATTTIAESSLQRTLDTVGSITAVQGVTLNAEVTGTIKRIAFESGANVQTGDVLVELDTSVERAQLQAAAANLELARLNLASGQSLVDKGAMPKNQFSALSAQAKQSEAELARLQALIAKKTIRAPFAGRTGLRQVNLGQLVGNGDPVVSLQSLDPVYVDFGLPQQRLSQLTVGATVHVATDVFPDVVFDGELSAIHPEVDVSTRNLRARATLKNPEGKLRPGMFATVQVALPSEERVLLVPVTSIAYAPYGDSLFVVDTKTDPKRPIVQQKFVRLGQTRGDFVEVTQGLSAGETVVTTGSFKLRNGMSVVINNELKPTPARDPKPTDT
jgi:membrane fusion protein (multidrug efflux system)